MVERVEALFREIPSSDAVEPILADRLRRGEAIPGFGHRLYPEGDPRAQALLAQITSAFPDSETVVVARIIESGAYALIKEKPTIDFALTVLSRALRLPKNSGVTLFAIGRSVGWIAHALEQYQLEEIIRPRAKYTGPLPHRA
jgi:citrate synthase